MVLIPCLYLLADGFLHKGLVRVMLPVSYPAHAGSDAGPLNPNRIMVGDKEWIKAVNSIERMNSVPDGVPGLECDVYYERSGDRFDVHHDKNASTGLTLDSLLSVYHQRNLKAYIWLDLKNLRDSNKLEALGALVRLREKFGLDNKILVESNHPECFPPFSDSGFFTIYYSPYFNPYRVSGDSILKMVARVTERISRYPISALSGYYFQYPYLHHYFPRFPLMIWTPDDRYSLTNRLFRKKIGSEKAVLVDLHP